MHSGIMCSITNRKLRGNRCEVGLGPKAPKPSRQALTHHGCSRGTGTSVRSYQARPRHAPQMC